MPTILITGGAGFIGSSLCSYLYNKYSDIKLIVLDALTYAGSTKNLPIDINDCTNARFEFVYGNICNSALVNSLLSRVDYVVHTAAETHVTRSIYDNKLCVDTDVVGTHTIANAVCLNKNIKKFIHISTSEVYGTAEAEFMDEKHPLNPASPYAAAKAGADRLVYSYWNTYGIPAIIVRPFNNYGPKQHLEKLIPRFITNAILGEDFRIHGNGSAARDFIYVEDTCSAIDLILSSEYDAFGQCFNLGSGVHRSILEIADYICEHMGVEKKYIFTGDRPGQVDRHTANAARVKEVFGWVPATSWKVGIEKTINWYKENYAIWRDQMWARNILITAASGKKELH